MRKADSYYLEHLNQILVEDNRDIDPRPKWEDGTPAHSIFITQTSVKYDIDKGEFPITTLRNTAVLTGIKEIFWIYQKQSNDLKLARELGIDWWDNWDIGDGTIGQRYGATIKKYDLMNNLLDGLLKDPFSRRHIIDLWQVDDFKQSMGLQPCAFMTMWSVRPTKDPNKRFIDVTLNQRSNDFIMAGFINQSQYVGFALMVIGHLNYELKKEGSSLRYSFGCFKHDVQNLHIYDRHIDAANELLNRNTIDDFEFLMELKEDKNFYDYTIDDFKISKSHVIPKIKSELPIAI